MGHSPHSIAHWSLNVLSLSLSPDLGLGLSFSLSHKFSGHYHCLPLLCLGLGRRGWRWCLLAIIMDVNNLVRLRDHAVGISRVWVPMNIWEDIRVVESCQEAIGW